ncbi:WYL domain-containing protein [Lacinutrix sp. WUR7]|uniref:helix-turn-helix transcriptional regulator n=1 Tax=Lacinutrix sp. WUR7 TaxID=2653681 RepID=UPI00193CBFFA|nr:WYL domain-containing protein [Lacinutrix sp. WUR7]QRM90773.1 WYL domain-containing protein [Lacinutrix sp. WUR7]
MSVQGKIKRYSLIIEKIKNGRDTSFEAIKDFLFDNGFEHTKRTIQRDFDDLRNEFGVEVLYDSSRNNYYIDYDNSPNFENFVRFLELVNTADLLKESFKTKSKSLEHIVFDNSEGLQGIQYLELFLTAIKQHREISFTHYNFQKNTTTKRLLKPYLLKEYANRWYIIGEQEGVKEFRNFGMDRVSNVQLTENTFEPNTDVDINYLYHDVIGMVYSENTKQRVVLSFTPEQGQYVKTLPLHHSQQILLDTNIAFQISLDVIPNRSLVERILMYGSSVKVMEPITLVDEIKGMLKATFLRY